MSLAAVGDAQVGFLVLVALTATAYGALALLRRLARHLRGGVPR